MSCGYYIQIGTVCSSETTGSLVCPYHIEIIENTIKAEVSKVPQILDIDNSEDTKKLLTSVTDESIRNVLLYKLSELKNDIKKLTTYDPKQKLISNIVTIPDIYMHQKLKLLVRANNFYYESMMFFT